MTRIHSVQVSVYSSDAYEHDSVTGIEGSYDSTINFIKKLNSLNVSTVFKSVQLKNTIHNYFKTKFLGESLSNKVVMDLSLSPGYANKNKVNNYQPSIEQMVDVYTSEWINSQLSVNNKHSPDNYPCSAGRKGLALSPCGDIYPCTGFPMKISNIYEEAIAKFWYNRYNNTQYHEWISIRITDLYKCNTYSYCAYCPEICAGAAWLKMGNYKYPSENSCQRAQALESVVMSQKLLIESEGR